MAAILRPISGLKRQGKGREIPTDRKIALYLSKVNPINIYKCESLCEIWNQDSL